MKVLKGIICLILSGQWLGDDDAYPVERAADPLHCLRIDAKSRRSCAHRAIQESPAPVFQRGGYRTPPEAVSLVLESLNGSTDSFNDRSPSRSRGSGQAKVRYSEPCVGCSCARAKPVAPWCRGRHWPARSRSRASTCEGGLGTAFSPALRSGRIAHGRPWASSARPART
jgi:hypothetical protein